MTNSEIYLRFLRETQSSDWSKQLVDIDATAQRVLELLAIASDSSQPMNVGQAMSAKWIASPATLHRKISDLINAGYVAPTYVGKNRRTRYLVPTDKADEFFSQMGCLMRLCLSEA